MGLVMGLLEVDKLPWPLNRFAHDAIYVDMANDGVFSPRLLAVKAAFERAGFGPPIDADLLEQNLCLVNGSWDSSDIRAYLARNEPALRELYDCLPTLSIIYVPGPLRAAKRAIGVAAAAMSLTAHELYPSDEEKPIMNSDWINDVHLPNPSPEAQPSQEADSQETVQIPASPAIPSLSQLIFTAPLSQPRFRSPRDLDRPANIDVRLVLIVAGVILLLLLLLVAAR